MENKKRTDLEECVVHYNDNYYLKTDVGYKKIILTTDQDLISNGIKQISDDMLLKIIEHINSGKNIDSFDELVTELVGYYKNTQLVEKHCTYFRQETKDSVKLEWFKKFKK